ncbi:serine/threonine-protein kinase pim-2-like [Oryzias latipes]|uniref:serine/threonine-protein kinase pim-2-like n=1 Tax=Oryzias latipes TaxID=8090 RepID=UPI000CE1EDA9|nr:serine/threonine-protein kinase pim-2-like [Oryzias latipes]
MMEKEMNMKHDPEADMKHHPDEEKTSSSRSKRVPVKRKACSDDDGETKKRKVDPSEPAEPIKPTGVKNKKEFLEKLKKIVEKSTFFSRTNTSSVNTSEDDFEAKYEQMEQLGEGGFGCVFGGFRRSDNLQVAIKRIEKGFDLNTEVDEHGQFICAEVAVMQKLKDPQLQSADKASPVVLLDWYDLKEEIILVMERPIPATDMEDYLKSRGGKIEEDEVKIIMKQLIRTAVDLEERHIFHRDIKIQNVLIETSSSVPRARLIDFGLSCFTKETSVFTDFAGTLSIAAPESMFGSGYRAEPTTVWQLGVVGYEALHGVGFNTRKFAMNKLKIREDLSPDCKSFLKKCLRFSPAFRPKLKELLQHPWLI